MESPPHVDFISIVQQPITNGIGHGRVTDVGMPVFNGTLTGNNGGSGLVTVFDHLQQIPAFTVNGQQKVIDTLDLSRIMLISVDCLSING